jgi:hypothetical protein
MSVRITTTLLTPASSHDLVTLVNLKADLAIAVTTDDTFLSRAIAKASQAAGQFCNRVFVDEKVQDVFDIGFPRLQWAGERVLQTSRFPVSAITSITEHGTPLVRDTDYRIDPATGCMLRLNAAGQVISWGSTPVTAIYNGGFATIPLDLQDAVTTIVKSLRFNRTRDPALRSENILSGLYAYTLFDQTQVPSGTAEQVASTLEAYRVPVMA